MIYRFSPIIKMLVFVCFFILISSKEALAYLDPGTGSMILQGILGAIAAVAVAGKIYWRRIKGFFGFKKDAVGNVSSERSNPEKSNEKSKES